MKLSTAQIATLKHLADGGTIVTGYQDWWRDAQGNVVKPCGTRATLASLVRLHLIRLQLDDKTMTMHRFLTEKGAAVLAETTAAK